MAATVIPTTESEPNWAVMPAEAGILINTLDKILAGDKLSTDEYGGFFKGLKARLAVTCKRFGEPGSEHACSAAIDVLYIRAQRRKPRDFDYVDKQLISALRRILKLATKVVVNGFEKVTTPTFTEDAMKAFAQTDLREILAAQPMDRSLVGAAAGLVEK